MSKKSVMILSNIFVNQPSIEIDKKKAVHFRRKAIEVNRIIVNRSKDTPEAIMNASFYSIEPWANE